MNYEFWLSPLGLMRVDANENGICAIWFDPDEHVLERPNTLTSNAVTQLSEYFAGHRRDFSLPLAAQGTPFQQRVWQTLQTIGYGETSTYGQMARQLGNPNAMRAVGAANGKNPISIVVPCHRVIGANGTLTGYAGGLTRKQYLLDLEQA